MEKNDIEKKIEKLEGQKKGFDSNRNLALVLEVFLIYVTFKDFNTNPGSPLFYVVMGILMAGALGIAVWGTMKINSIKKEISEASKELEASEE